MHHHVTIVLAGAAAHFFTGWLVSLDLILGKVWKEEKDKKLCNNVHKDMRVRLGLQAIVSIVLAIATCVAIAIFEKSQASVASKSGLEKLAHLFFNHDHAVKSIMSSIHTVLFVWAGFILPISVERVIWCGHNWKYWLLEMSKELVCLVAIAATVTFLS